MTKNNHEIDNWVSKWVGQQPNADDKDVQKLLYRRAYDILGQAVAYRADASEGQQQEIIRRLPQLLPLRGRRALACERQRRLTSAIPMRRSVRPRGASRVHTEICQLKHNAELTVADLQSRPVDFQQQQYFARLADRDRRNLRDLDHFVQYPEPYGLGMRADVSLPLWSSATSASSSVMSSMPRRRSQGRAPISTPKGLIISNAPLVARVPPTLSPS